MELRLIPHSELQGTGYAQFVAGSYYRATLWSPDSLYLDMDTFEAVCHLVGYFNLYGPETLSGARLKQCIADLEALAKQVSQSESPGELWDYAPNYGLCQFQEVETNWSTGRRDFSLLLRDLAVWMRGVHRRKEPVTCLGL